MAGPGDEGGEGAGAATDTLDGDFVEEEAGENAFGLDPDEEIEGVTPEARRDEEDEEDDEATEEIEDDDDPDDEDPDDDPDEYDDPEEEEEDDEQAESDEDEDDDDWVGERAELVSDRWDRKLSTLAQEGKGQGPKLNLALGAVQLRKEGLERYKQTLEREGGDDAEVQAEAMFEIAMDAVMQTISEYHHNSVQAPIEQSDVRVAKQELKERQRAFRKTPEGKAMAKDEKLQERMQEAFQKVKGKHGWRLAMEVPFEDYYKMARGPRLKKGKAAREKPAEDPGEKHKRAALGAGRTPRGRRSQTPAGAGKPRPKTVEQESAEYIRRTSEPFFQVT